MEYKKRHHMQSLLYLSISQGRSISRANTRILVWANPMNPYRCSDFLRLPRSSCRKLIFRSTGLLGLCGLPGLGQD